MKAPPVRNSPTVAAIGIVSALFILCGSSLCVEVPVNNVIDVITGVGIPGGIAVSPNSKSVYVTGFDQNIIYVVDAATNQVIANDIFGGSRPVLFALTPNGKTLYISNEVTPGTMSVLDTKTLTLGPTVTGIAANPVGIAASPNGKLVYIAGFLSDTVDVYDIAKGTLLTPITVAPGPAAIAFTPNSKTAYISSIPNGTVSVVDVAKGVVEGSPITVGLGAAGMVVTPDGKKLYTLNGTSISVIDTKTNMVVDTIGVGNQDGAFPALTPDGKYLYVPLLGASAGSPGTVVVISTATEAMVGTPITVGVEPIFVAIAPDGKRAYVANFNGGSANGSVTVIAIDE